jgi:hypothetical protein
VSSMEGSMQGSNDSHHSIDRERRQKRVQKRRDKAIARAEDEEEQRSYLQRWEAKPEVARAINQVGVSRHTQPSM